MPAEPSSPPVANSLSESVREGLARILDAGDLRMPMLPEVARQLLSEEFREKATAKTLSELIHRDQMLAGQVLRVSNSAAFNPGSPIVSLQQAVVRMGLERIRELALAAALESGAFQVPGAKDLVLKLWMHSAAAGAFAKEVARARRANVEAAFLCGLFHDLGKPVVITALFEFERKSGKRCAPEDWTAALREFHVSAGLKLAERWALPESTREAIASHHLVESGAAAGEGALTAALASALSHWALEEGEDPAAREALLRNPLWPKLDLYPADAEIVLGKRADALRFAEAFS